MFHFCYPRVEARFYYSGSKSAPSRWRANSSINLECLVLALPISRLAKEAKNARSSARYGPVCTVLTFFVLLIVLCPRIIHDEDKAFSNHAFDPEWDQKPTVDAEISVIAMVIAALVIIYMSRNEITAESSPR